MLYEIVAVVVVVLIAIILLRIFKRIFFLIINSIIGLFALIGFNYLFHANITINFWSVLITAIGGIIGFGIVIGMHFLGWAF